ncbi:MAG: fluoride efflux transporter CrcB [Oscillospiraceae bacterium]|jgi:CrcB protein|nr:fluoride efflux transporter CrcB [Oscillospiraceae bacterium]
MEVCLLVAAGGAVGAVFRYLLGLIPVAVQFPLMTLLINFSGAVLIGMVTSMPSLPANAVFFLKTGVCGGFTTFSTFSLDTIQLLKGENLVLGILNAAASVGFCLLGVLLGQWLGSCISRTAA